MWFLCYGCRYANVVANVVIIDFFPLAYGCQFHVANWCHEPKEELYHDMFHIGPYNNNEFVNSAYIEQ
jgi:hypothetical protein